MLEPHELRDAMAASFGDGSLAGLKVVVSAGPTYEDIDPVRFIGNRSSGRMGFAVAQAAALAGANVTLVAGPVSLATPAGVARRIDVRSAAQMHAAVLDAALADIYIGAAAVGDYRPQEVSAHKLKKHDGAGLSLQLSENPDILASLSAQTGASVSGRFRRRDARCGELRAAQAAKQGAGHDCCQSGRVKASVSKPPTMR
jgi:phosphopantothenoylcysteine decarboxylase/phosphopantothenate--cysteine ligase